MSEVHMILINDINRYWFIQIPRLTKPQLQLRTIMVKRQLTFLK